MPWQNDGSFLVDLRRFSGGGKVFSGRDKGRECRREAALDEADARNAIVDVYVPEYAYSVNSSFFLGMFGDSVRHHGEKGFRELYRFTGKDITKTVEDGIREALDDSSPLAMRA